MADILSRSCKDVLQFQTMVPNLNNALYGYFYTEQDQYIPPNSRTPRRAAGVALQARAVADHGETAAFGAGFADIAFHPHFRRLASLSSLLSNLDIVRLARWLRDRQPIPAHAFEMKLDRLTDLGLHLLRRIADRYAAG